MSTNTTNTNKSAKSAKSTKSTKSTKNPIRKITINGVEYKVKRTIKAMFIMEQITGHPFAINTLQEQYLFFWCMLYANNPDTCLDYDDFLNAIDDDNDLIQQLLRLNDDENTRDAMLSGEDGKDGEDGEDGEDKKKVAKMVNP